MFIFLVLIFGKDCEIQKEGLVLAEFYKENNSLHQLMEPIVEIVSNISQRNNLDLKIQKIDCGVCECKGLGEFPTFKLIKDDRLVDSFFGFKPYDKFVKFLSNKVDEKIFHRALDLKEDIVELEERDFYSGFDGPWLILFYYESKEENDKLLKQIKNVFGGRVMIGKIKYNESKYLESRFHIRAYPTVFGMYNGLSIPFLDVLNIHNLIKFTNKLLSPAFKPISHKELLSLSQDKEPIYVVLHKNESKANETFFKFAHNFKFKIRMYNSQDPVLFEHAKVFPSEEEEALIVYKNGSFFVYDGNISDENSIVEWIFHTHFPNVTAISNASFHSIFNGLKPVFLLLTDHEEFLEELEAFSNDIHLGKPYLHILFSAINLNEYALFTASLLPKIEVPSFVIYNPLDKKFYHKKMVLKKENFNKEAEETLKLFETGSLKPYGHQSSSVYFWVILGSFFLCVCYFVRSKTMRVI